MANKKKCVTLRVDNAFLYYCMISFESVIMHQSDSLAAKLVINTHSGKNY